ncbi:MAG: murein L,D-transpeptidase [Bryobacteraceae bacterium]|nr:murein L,D-transpeptidase [Bryobacteraceae bacterium]
MRVTQCLCLTVALSLALLDAAPAKKVRRGAQRTRVAEKPLDLAAVNNPAWTTNPSLAMVLRAQILLARAHFSPGEIDGQTGANLTRALSGFQSARKIEGAGELNGKLNEATWTALNEGATAVLIPYTLTPEDVSGPFLPIPEDMLEQAKLPTLGYASLEEKLGEKFHISPELLRKMNPEAKLTEGEAIQVPDIGAVLEGVKADRVVVTKAGVLTAFDKDGNVIAQYPASSGSEHDPLPLGIWKVNGIARNPPFSYNPDLFWDAKPEHTKARIPPGPNNPVGVVWIDLTKEHYGIHGTPVPASVGHSQSHGCIRLTNWDVQELSAIVSRNTPVICEE